MEKTDMHALQIAHFGTPAEVVQLASLPEPDAPAAGEVLAAVEYAPINHSEILKIEGHYPLLPASFPAGVGNEGVARILAVGSNVTDLAIGDRVLIPQTHYAWRERLVMPAAGLFALPAGADPRQLSMLSINPPTAALLLSEFVDLKPGDWVIQDAGNSGVGRSVIAIAKHLGLRTVSLVRRQDLVQELCAAGGDVVLVDGPDVRVRVAAATANAAIALAIDLVGGESTALLAACLAPAGVVVVYSVLGSRSIVANGLDLIFRDIVIRGFWIYGPRYRSSPKIAAAMKLGAQLVADGKLNVPIARTYPLTAAAEALSHAEGGGKVLFTMNGD
jgi:NADPH:quinone reductase-like Zn-dependent oxidoreductase